MSLVKRFLEHLKSDPLSVPTKAIRGIKLRLINVFKKYILRDELTLEASRWFKDQGDSTLRLDYVLNDQSIVFDVGGYRGNFAYDINKKYNCSVFLFEPSLKFYNLCVERFKDNPKIHCFHYGLSDKNGEFLLSDDDDGSSLSLERNSESNKSEIVKVRGFNEVFNDLKLDTIDLLKINIEGGEFELLPHIFKSNLIEKISNVQVQFHNFIGDAELKRSVIRNELSQTHINNWCYKFIWENWQLKNK